MKQSGAMSFVWALFLFLMGLPVGVLAGDPTSGVHDYERMRESGKANLPEEADSKRALAFVKEVYGDRYNQAATVEQQLELAEKIIVSAGETTDDPAGQYYLLLMAKKLVTKANIVTSADAAHTWQLAGTVLQSELDKEHYGVCRDLCGIQSILSKKIEDAALQAKTSENLAKVTRLERASSEIRDANKVLEKDPLNAAANLTLGKYYCFIKENWTRGLPLLKLGSDETLSQLASQDLKRNDSTADQLRLADRWYDAAASIEKESTKACRRRAAHWYQQALPNLSGLKKEVAQKRVLEASGRLTPGTAPAIDRFGSSKELNRTYYLKRGGGDRITQQAVKRGLAWLARQQRADGSWSLTGPYASSGRIENVASATAMALLAFQRDGNTPVAGEFAGVVAKGWKYLAKLEEDGFYAGEVSNPQHRMYTQAQCSIAACELYGMTGDAQYKPAAQRAITYAVKAQDPQLGGWRYIPGVDSDMSVTAWFGVALESARMAELEVPKESVEKVIRFLNAVQQDGGRQYNYRPGNESTPAVTAGGLLCRRYLDYKPDDLRMLEGASALNRQPITYAQDHRTQDVYYWYYATQVCYHMQNPTVNAKKYPIWDQWNNVLRTEVPAHQVAAGPEVGSWDPAGDKWGSEGGRLYVTCLSIYMLEVYYRQLPPGID